MVITASMIINI